MLGAAEVVDEAVDSTEALERRRDHPLGLAGPCEVGGNVQIADPLARFVPT